MKEKFIIAFMQTAKIFGNLSSARKLKVGAIAVKDDRIISIGYNGMPSGWDNDCEYQFTDTDGMQYLKTNPEVLHAEMNCLMKLARSTESGINASMFITHAPCMECAKGIWQTGIKEVFYEEDYKSNQGIEFLQKCQIPVRKVLSCS